MRLLKPKDPVRQFEADLASGQSQLDRLRAGLQRAQAELQSASEARLAMLVDSEEASGNSLTKATEAVRTAESNAAGIEQAIAVVEGKIRSAEESIAGVHETRERARIADRLEARAIAIENAAARLDDTARSFSEARRALLDAIDAGGISSDGFHHADRFAAQIVAAGVRLAAPGVLPEAMPSELSGLPASPNSASTAAANLQTAPLRHWAAGIRAGGMPAVEPAGPPPPPLHVDLDETGVVLRESISFKGMDGRTVLINQGGGMLPAPVAAHAVGLGIAFAPDSEKGLAIQRDLARGQGLASGLRRGDPVLAVTKDDDGKALVRRGPPYRDIGFSLYEYVRDVRSGKVAA